jgi:hypothetical protein
VYIPEPAVLVSIEVYIKPSSFPHLFNLLFRISNIPDQKNLHLSMQHFFIQPNSKPKPNLQKLLESHTKGWKNTENRTLCEDPNCINYLIKVNLVIM